jgi:hypothetical protein
LQYIMMKRQHTSLGAWLCKRDVQRPLLPAYILVGPPKEVGLFPLLLEELDDELAPAPLLVRAVYSPHQGNGPLLNQRLEIDVVNGGKGEIEQVAGEGRYRGEVAVEEYGVQNRCSKCLAGVPRVGPAEGRWNLRNQEKPPGTAHL